MAVYTSYDEVGIKEDISDVITNISPTKTPFLSSMKTEKIHQKLHQWQEDSLSAVASNAQVEGFDATDGVLTATTLRNNYTQILSDNIKVSGSADASLAYGRAKESAYQISKKAAQLKRDLEYALVGINQASAAGADGTARQMASYQAQIDASSTLTLGTAATVSESNVLTVLQDIYTNGAEASILMVKPADSLVVAAWAQAAGRYRTFQEGTSGAKSLTNVVNLYVSPFGEQKVVINRFQLTSTLLCYDPEYWRLLVFRSWFRETLAKTGDNLKMMIVGEFSLKHKNYKASGMVSNIT